MNKIRLDATNVLGEPPISGIRAIKWLQFQNIKPRGEKSIKVLFAVTNREKKKD